MCEIGYPKAQSFTIILPHKIHFWHPLWYRQTWFTSTKTPCSRSCPESGRIVDKEEGEEKKARFRSRIGVIWDPEPYQVASQCSPSRTWFQRSYSSHMVKFAFFFSIVLISLPSVGRSTKSACHDRCLAQRWLRPRPGRYHLLPD